MISRAHSTAPLITESLARPPERAGSDEKGTAQCSPVGARVLRPELQPPPAVVFAAQARVTSRHRCPTPVDRSIYFLINWQLLAHAWLFDLQGQKLGCIMKMSFSRRRPTNLWWQIERMQTPGRRGIDRCQCGDMHLWQQTVRANTHLQWTHTAADKTTSVPVMRQPHIDNEITRE